MEELWQIEANIDDMNPQIMEYLFSRLLEFGVNDVWAMPMMMKKCRMASMVCVLCQKEQIDGVLDILFAETTSIGARYFPVQRRICERTIQSVRIDGEDIHCKISSYGGKVTNISAEYDDCRRAAARTKRPVKEWQRLAKEEAYRRYGHPITTGD
ncbi:nickel insertion protein [uncultured Megasphaera sp.]|uniref:nickel insertion protein n=1 Tax=uncultured Megasphaera sp. TaxID=165188 RepID=UPI00265A554D|nr:nickel insertion protein [uncultured Megasphaera sp.]